MSKIINGVSSEYDMSISEEVQVLSRWVDPTIEQLQQENQQLKEINEEHKKLNGELREENKKYKEVIKKVKKMIIDNIEETTYEYIGSNKIKVLLELRMDNDGVNKLLDILKDVE